MHSERQSSEQKRFCVELLLQMASQVSKPESACAACKFQKKKCSDKCVLAPYFPQKDLKKFLLVHRLFGYGHVVKLLQDLPAEQRADAVSSLVYEAKARVKDPVNGCTGVISDLQKKLEEVQLQLVSKQAELANISLLTVVTGYDPNFYSASQQESQDTQYTNPQVFDDDIVDPLPLWEPSIWS